MQATCFKVPVRLRSSLNAMLNVSPMADGKYKVSVKREAGDVRGILLRPMDSASYGTFAEPSSANFQKKSGNNGLECITHNNREVNEMVKIVVLKMVIIPAS